MPVKKASIKISISFEVETIPPSAPNEVIAFGIFNSSTKSGDKADVSLSGVYIPTDKTTFIPGKVYYSDRDGVLTLDKYNFSTDITETTDTNSKYTTTLTVSNYLRIGTAIATDKLLLNIGIEKSETISVSDGGLIAVPAEQV